MLKESIIQKIIDFVYVQPRSIDEIAKHINKSWKTTSRYVERIAKEKGIIGIKIFRKGTRGALKIVYWKGFRPIHSTSFQHELFERIKNGKTKYDFSPFDIYQHVPQNKKRAFLEIQKSEKDLILNKDLPYLLKKAEEEILIFSGDLSWSNLYINDKPMLNLFEKIAKKGVLIKILARVDIASLNKKLKNPIEIRHREQPLRAIIIDSNFCRFKETRPEVKNRKKMFVFYDVYDEEWIKWIKEVFWSLFSSSIPAEIRLEELESIRRISGLEK